MLKINEIMMFALTFEEGHVRRTQHILKVHSLVKLIAEYENIVEENEILQIAAILHDIGIKPAKEKYNDASQENQMIEMRVIVTTLLEKMEYPNDLIKRVIYLIENHHNYKDLNDLSHQVLIEGDLIINFFESPEKNPEEYKKYFRTKTGIRLFTDFFIKKYK